MKYKFIPVFLTNYFLLNTLESFFLNVENINVPQS